MKRKKVNIKQIFGGLQQQMDAKLSLNREILTHTTTKGDASELEWIEMLSNFLPKRYEIDKAFVINFEGFVSDQIDLVIYDRHFSPFILHQNGAKFIPAESVYAVIEIKPTLTSANIKYAAEKAKSVRTLERTSAPIVQADGAKFTPKPPFKILAGILTIDGDCTKAVEKELKSLTDDGCINFGCSLKGTYFGLQDFAPWSTKTDISNYEIINKSTNSLVLFFLGLVSELKKLGTVPSMDVEKYIHNIK